MKSFAAHVVAIGLGGVVATAAWPQKQPATAGNNTDVYHVHFTKAAPGQAAALGKALMVPDIPSCLTPH